MHDVILETQALAKTFRLHARDTQLAAFDDINLCANRGELLALCGTSGAGKSSILKCIYRTYLASSGSIRYHARDGKQYDLATAPEHTLIELRQNEISFVTQFLSCPPRQSALDVVASSLTRRGVNRHHAREEAASMLKQLALPEQLWQLPPTTFSGGEKQRVNVARALVSEPHLLLLDEPTASLDAESVQRVLAQLQALKAKGTAIIAIFHDTDLIDQVADQRLVVKAPSECVAPSV